MRVLATGMAGIAYRHGRHEPVVLWAWVGLPMGAYSNSRVGFPSSGDGFSVVRGPVPAIRCGVPAIRDRDFRRPGSGFRRPVPGFRWSEAGLPLVGAGFSVGRDRNYRWLVAGFSLAGAGIFVGRCRDFRWSVVGFPLVGGGVSVGRCREFRRPGSSFPPSGGPVGMSHWPSRNGLDFRWSDCGFRRSVLGFLPGECAGQNNRNNIPTNYSGWTDCCN